ncbi:MAG: cob(I)yrinic acid a,c-diamide adenosyltransferase [Prevotellaceae bacterium]|jgi:cob(I)alamin adenosyltransferase|nr:cob(I)yrinic acid a,c-diamide adenosyltransferase [Prevotellaceae bacterium]
MKGYIHIYTGNGKGKTTAALGLALRAAGAGKKVFFAQFVKGQVYSEVDAINKYLPSITVKQYGLDCFIISKPTRKDIAIAERGFREIAKIVMSDEYDVIVLDEACIAIYYNLFTAGELIDLITGKPERTEIIITGRYASPELTDVADLVTEMREIKHYYRNGVEARKGIEY